MDASRFREDFPALERLHRGKPLIYLDSACVTLRPRQVIAKIVEYYSEYPGCHGRTSYLFGRRTTEEYEASRRKVQRFLNARRPEEIIFTKNTTEAINIVARGFGFRPGQAILGSAAEHTSNLVPWQIVAAEKGLRRRTFPLRADLAFDRAAFQQVLEEQSGTGTGVRIVTVHHVSNLTGVELPLRDICRLAHRHGALVLADGAQAVPHRRVDMQELDADFYCFSGHKMLGPSGTGVLYAKRELLDEIPQLVSGGETVTDTTFETHTLAPLPDRFEAGLQNYAGVIGLGAAVDYLSALDLEKLRRHETRLNALMTDSLLAEPGVSLIGPADPSLRPSILNVVLSRRNPHDVARILDEAANIMVRAGKHCVHSWYNRTHTQDSLRASLHCYNTEEDVQAFAETLKRLLRSWR